MSSWLPEGGNLTSNYRRTASSRPSASQATPSSSDSQPRPMSSSQQASLAGVARRDYETTSVARPPSNRRSSSRDRSNAAPPPKRTESTRDSRRTSGRPGGHSRNSSHMDPKRAAAPVGPSGSSQTPTSARAAAEPPIQVSGTSTTRKRTEIDAQTGKWSLGKTIGAGSMGKVKLAKNLETGEQVRFVLRELNFYVWVLRLTKNLIISVR